MTESIFQTRLAQLPDSALINKLRQGDESAYAILWERHHQAGIQAARAITSRHDPEDLVQEAFTRIYQAILNGKGPTEGFRSYLYATIRSVSMAWSNNAITAVELTHVESELITDTDLASLTENNAFTARAFRDLPADWRTVLWYTEVEGLTPAEIAPLMGVNARAVSALAFRAREGLREAWLQAHISTTHTAEDEECQWTEKNLGAYTRDNLSHRRTERLQNHLSECNKCAVLCAELHDVSSSLRGILLPLVLGVPAASVAGSGLFVAPAASTAAAAGTAGAAHGTQVFSAAKKWVQNNPATSVVVASGVLVAVAVAVASGVLTSPPETVAVQAPPAALSTPSAGPSAPSTQSTQSASTESNTEPQETQQPSEGTLSEQTTRPTHVGNLSTPTTAPTVSTPTVNPDENDKSDEQTSTPDSSDDSTPSAEPTPTPTTSTPVETPRPDPSSPDPTPAPTPSTPVVTPVTIDTESVNDGIFMPRFMGRGEPGSTIEVIDDVKIRGRSAAAANVAAPAVGQTTVPDDGLWTVDVSSDAATQGTRRYMVLQRNEDGDITSRAAITTTYTFTPASTNMFSIEHVYYDGARFDNGDTIEFDDDERHPTVNFTLVSQQRNTVNFRLNGEVRKHHNVGESSGFQWTIDTVQEINTIEARQVDLTNKHHPRYGPWTTLFTFKATTEND